MNITLNVVRKGNEHGTVGWLANHAASITLGHTTLKKRAIWLKDHEGATMCLLAMQDPYDLNGDGYTDPTAWVIVSECDSHTRPSLDFATTQACFASLQQLAEEAVSLVYEIDEDEQPITFTVSRGVV